MTTKQAIATIANTFAQGDRASIRARRTDELIGIGVSALQNVHALVLEAGGYFNAPRALVLQREQIAAAVACLSKGLRTVR